MQHEIPYRPVLVDVSETILMIAHIELQTAIGDDVARHSQFGGSISFYVRER